MASTTFVYWRHLCLLEWIQIFYFQLLFFNYSQIQYSELEIAAWRKQVLQTQRKLIHYFAHKSIVSRSDYDPVPDIVSMY